MYQNLVEGREVPWSLLVKDMPKSKHQDVDFIVDQLDWAKNVDPNFKDNHYLEPIPVKGSCGVGYTDRWIVYGRIDGQQLFTAKELTVEPGAKCTIKDGGAYGLITVQGKGRINNLELDCPKLIRFHELTRDEVTQMVDMMMKRLTSQLEGQGLGIELTQAAKELLARRGYDPQLGARPLRRAIQDRKSTRLNSSHIPLSRMPSSA